MKVTYVDYSDRLFDRVSEYCTKYYEENPNSDIVLIFPDFMAKRNFIKTHPFGILAKNPEILSFDELSEKIFIPTGKKIISGLEAICRLYDKMPEDFLDKYHMTEFAEFSSFARSFFNYYGILYKNNISPLNLENLIKIHKWQRENIQIFAEAKTLFDNLCGEYIHSGWIEQMAFFDDTYMQNKLICLVDIGYLPRIYAEIFGSDKYEVTMILQLPESDYDARNLKITQLSMPENIDTNIQITKVLSHDALSYELIRLQSNNSNISVYSPQGQNCDFYNIFPRVFSAPSSIKYSDTMGYKAILDCHKAVKNAKIHNNKILYQLEDLLPLSKNKVFRNIFGLTQGDIRALYDIIDNDYKFLDVIDTSETEEKSLELSLETLENKEENDEGTVKPQDSKIKPENAISQNWQNVRSFLDELGRAKSVNEIYMALLPLLKSLSKDVLMPALGTLDVLQQSCEKDTSSWIFDVFMETLGKLKVTKTASNSEADKIDIQDLYSNTYMPHDCTGVFIDMTDTLVPGAFMSDTIFTDNQCDKLSIQSTYDKKQLARKAIFQNIFKYNDVILYTYEDENEKISISPIIEEMVIKYNLPIIDSASMTQMDIIHILENRLFSRNPEAPTKSEEFVFDKNFAKWDEIFKLSAYDYVNMNNCAIKLFLQKIVKLPVYKQMDKAPMLTPKYMGNLFHKAMQKFFEIHDKENPISTTSDEIKNIFIKLVDEDEGIKLHSNMRDYLCEIVIPKFVYSARTFVDKLNNDMASHKYKLTPEKHINYTNFYSENGISVNLKGIADLILSSPEESQIFDYKTGNSSPEQFYFYKVAAFGDKPNIKTTLFNVWTNKFDKIEEKDTEKDPETGSKVDRTLWLSSVDGMKQILHEFLSEENIPMATSDTKVCAYCDYSNICGLGDK